MNDTLTELLGRCATGDDEAVETLVGRFQAWALGFAASLLDDKDTAPDVVQESFIAALESLASLREADAFPGWFRQIIRTQVSRVNRRRTEYPLGEKTDLKSNAPTPRDELHRRNIAARVRQAVQSLPPASRVTTELFYFDEMKHVDIAAHLQLPLGTVKRRLYDSRRTLRVLLLGISEETGQTGTGHSSKNNKRRR